MIQTEWAGLNMCSCSLVPFFSQWQLGHIIDKDTRKLEEAGHTQEISLFCTSPLSYRSLFGRSEYSKSLR